MVDMSKFENKIAKCDELKKQLDQLRPLKKSELASLKDFYRVGQTYSSNALEGNTLTEIETKVIIEDGLTVSGKPLREVYEATGNAAAFDFIMGLAQKDLFNEQELLKTHQFFYEKLDSSKAGVYRISKVFISGTDLTLPGPEEVPALVKKFIADLGSAKKKHPIELAALVHNQFVTIHPFYDGNGRTARLLMNLILIQNGHPVTVIPPIYRVQYLELTRQGNDGIHGPFTNFLSCMVYESLKDLLRMLGN